MSFHFCRDTNVCSWEVDPFPDICPFALRKVTVPLILLLQLADILIFEFAHLFLVIYQVVYRHFDRPHMTVAAMVEFDTSSKFLTNGFLVASTLGSRPGSLWTLLYLYCGK